MNFNWSDILGQVVATAITAIVGIMLTFLIQRFRKNKAWFGKNWLIIVAFLEALLALYQTFTLDPPFSKAVSISFTFTSAVLFISLYFFIRSNDFSTSITNTIKQKFDSEISITVHKLNDEIEEVKKEYNDKIDEVDTKIKVLKTDLLVFEAKDWERQSVYSNAYRTYIEILEIAPVTTYQYRKALYKLEEVIPKIEKAHIKADLDAMTRLNRILKLAPDDYSEIVRRILALL
jgi:hypothetical protein